MINPSHKFRPYFSAAELAEIIRCVKTSSKNADLLRYLETFAIKINHGTLSPQHTLAPTLESKLGLADSASKSDPVDMEILYDQWMTNPEKFTPTQIALVHQYRWETEKMSSIEALEYERTIVGA